MSNISLIAPLVEEGLDKLLQQDIDNESGKAGILRGGNTGIYIKETNQVYGKCARQTFTRFKGLKLEQIDPSRKLMFMAGVGNEDLWIQMLKESYQGVIKAEEQIPTKWQTDKGTLVTGRPDVVLCKEDGTPVRGIELKLVSSVWTARDVLFEDTPKFEHLCQAAHYSWQLDVPFELWYTSRSDYHMNPMLERLMPPNSPYIEYAYYTLTASTRAKSGYTKRRIDKQFLPDIKDTYRGMMLGTDKVVRDPLKILPFMAGYVLTWNHKGFLTYTSVSTGKQTETIITKQRLKDYYELVDTIEESKTLPPLVIGVKGNGEKLNYSPEMYSPLAEINQKFLDFNSWWAEVQLRFGNKED